MAFHEAITAATHNELLAGLMYSLREIVWKYILLSNQMTETLTTTIAEHEAVYQCHPGARPRGRRESHGPTPDDQSRRNTEGDRPVAACPRSSRQLTRFL